MRKYGLIIFSFLLLSFGCKNEPQVTKEPWIEKPVSEWPDFALTNKISFTDTTYTDIANSFLVNTGIDTIGVSCKHFFMVFEKQLGIHNIDLGPDFKYWDLYPKNKKEKAISIKKLINRNPNEKIGQFNTLKVRDWIIFYIKSLNTELYPLKIRFTRVKKKKK
ncbi:hypothetical protein [Algibacter sp. R77976]|uniref:hypothetical protein n=1 Tax=Algibacter sp. R77976 TaxID=3093873 RepID=UPI0037C5AB7B